MMKKITNWTFGSIFRTIGRIVAYLVIGFLITLFVTKKDYVKADTIKNVFMQDMREKSSNTQLGWDNNFRTYTIQWSANSQNANGTYTIVSDNNVLPILNGKRPYKLQYQIRIDNNNNNENAIANNDDFNMILTGLSINSFPVWTKEDGTGAGGGLCEVNQSYNNALEKFLTITCNITEDTYKLNELRIMWYWTGGTYNSTNFIRIGVSTNFNYIYDDGIGTQIQEQTQEINNTLTNDTTYDTNETDNIFSDFQDMLPDEGIVTQLVTLPISLYSNILNSVNGTCRPFSLGNLLGTNLTLPCINVANYLGSQLWSVIDILMSGFFILTIVRKFIKVFENMSSMKEGDVLSD